MASKKEELKKYLVPMFVAITAQSKEAAEHRICLLQGITKGEDFRLYQDEILPATEVSLDHQEATPFTVAKPLSFVKASDGTAGFFIDDRLIIAENPCADPCVEMVARNTSAILGIPLDRLTLDLENVDEWGFDDMLELAKEQAVQANDPTGPLSRR